MKFWIFSFLLPVSCLSYQSLELRARPAGVKVEILSNGRVRHTCLAPCSVRVAKKPRTVVRYSEEGFWPQSYMLALSADGPRPFFAHWSYYIPPIIFVRALVYLIKLNGGHYDRLVGVPPEVFLEQRQGSSPGNDHGMP